MFSMFDINYRSAVSLRDVDAEIHRLVASMPSRVTDAAKYHLSAGGARVRAQLGIEAAAALNLSAQASIACAAAPELLHNASLVHDDLQDGDVIRRGAATVWSKYGNDIAISTGDLLISAAYMAIANHPHPARALGMMHHAIAVTIAGQTANCSDGIPTPEECANVAANKSGPLLALPICLALIAAQAPGHDIAERAGRALAIAYQTLDDIDDRAADLAIAAPNICLSLEASGYAPDHAQALACDRASSALHTARQEACALPNNVGGSFLRLADRLEIQLEAIVNAT
jgi:geranylgeranyl pyrophosphate synthase